MKIKLLVVLAVLVVGLLAFTSNAQADFNYFDADVLGYTLDGGAKGMDTPVPANTTLLNGDPVPVQIDGGSGGTGVDGIWRVRTSNGFGNRPTSAEVLAETKPTADPGDGTVRLVGDILEARGDFGEDNSEELPTLKTTVAVPAGDVGQEKGILVFFWSTVAGGQSWQVGADLTNSNIGPLAVGNELQPVFSGGSPDGYVRFGFDEAIANDGTYLFPVYDASADLGALPGSSQNPLLAGTDSLLTTSDGANSGGAAGDRALWAAFLGNQTLGSALTVFVNHSVAAGLDFAPNVNGRARTWYDGIGYTDPIQGLAPAEDVKIPEPTTLVLLGLGVVGLVGRRRRG